MAKKIVNIYAYIYACCWVFCRFMKGQSGCFRKALEKLDAAGEWMQHQVDHNDFVEGFFFALTLFLLPWVLGIINIIVTGAK